MEKEVVNKFVNLSAEEIGMLSPLQLAYIGDGVYEVFIRTKFLNGKYQVAKLNKLARTYVMAKGQAGILSKLDPILKEEEKAVVRRGRNAKSRVPKNTDLMDYKLATGFEALIGYLYLLNRPRLEEILSYIDGYIDEGED